MIKRAAKSALKRLGLAKVAPAPFSQSCVSLPALGPSRGHCLLAYILQPFQTPDQPIASSHTHFLESTLMAQVWRELGYHVDVIDYRYAAFQPSVGYDVFVSARKHLAEVAARLEPACLKLAHLDTTHFATNNAAAYARLLSFQARHGVSVPESLRIIEHNTGIDAADRGMMLGSSSTRASYDYAQKPIDLLNVPAVQSYPSPSGKNFEAARRRFFYLGSGGLLHKGLDLVLEAFLEMPELELIVCGPTQQETRFLDVYAERLRGADNIHIHGWIDVSSPEFQKFADQCVGVVYPSCAEGQAGSVVTCVRAGLLPIVTAESGVSWDHGALITEASVAAVQDAVRSVADRPALELAALADAAWQAGIDEHSREAYLKRYRATVAEILA